MNLLQIPTLKLSPSSIARFLTCPEKYELGKTHETKTSEAMRDGQLFEGYLMGFESEERQRKLEGRKKIETLDFIKKQAEFCKDIFGEGEKQKYIEYKSDSCHLRGFVDFVGQIDTEKLSKVCGMPIDPFLSEAIVDIKYTANVSKVWDEKDEQEELLQATIYPYIWSKIHGEIIPFFYFVVDSTFEKPVVRVINVEINTNDFYFIENIIRQIDAPFGHDPKVSPETCGGSRHSQPKCPYLEHCKYGRAFIGGYEEIRFNR